MKPKPTKAPARNATLKKNPRKSLVEMDSDEILETYGHSVAGGEKREVKKKPRMPVSGKKVFVLREIILNKAKKSKAS